MKSAEELAKEITAGIGCNPEWGREKTLKWLTPIIAEYAEERVRDFKKRSLACEYAEEWISEARTAALEEAAKVADALFSVWKCPCGEKIAEGIRALIGGTSSISLSWKSSRSRTHEIRD